MQRGKYPTVPEGEHDMENPTVEPIEPAVDLVIPDLPLIGASRPMRRVLEQVRRVARIRSTVLIRGESGTGKEVVARAIHSLSEAPGRFITVDCTNLPASLMESELFGHERGAFTDARTQKTGLLQTADGGTVLAHKEPAPAAAM